MMAWMKVRLLAPQRYTELSAEEEKIRAELTWQLFDQQLYLAAFGNAKALKDKVALPQQFIENRKNTVFVMSDQIPFWVGLGKRLNVYAQFEVEGDQARVKRRRLRRKFMAAAGLERTAGGVQPSQVAADVEDEEGAQAPHHQGMTQKRGLDAGGDKLRVTFENRNAVYFYLDEEKAPKGVLLPSLLLVHGAHARLSNIDDEHRWIKEETFWEGGVRKQHLAGHKTKGHLASYVELRKSNPELFKDLVVMAAPAGFMTEVTQVWAIEDVYERCGQTVHQRDMLGSAMAATARKAMQLCQSIPTWIAGKMTPALQLTDTDVAHRLKAFARREKQRVLTDQKHAAQAAGVEPMYSCGPEQIVRIAAGAHARLEQAQEEDDFIVAGMCRAGHFAYRPSLAEQKLVNPWEQEQEWTKVDGRKIGSHRMKDEWLDQRYQWRDAKGVPVPPDFSRSSAKRLERMAEPDYMPVGVTEDHKVKLGGMELDVPVVNLDGFEDQEFVDREKAQELKHPRLKRREAALERVTPGKMIERLARRRSYWVKMEKKGEAEVLKDLMDEGWEAYLETEMSLGAHPMEILNKLEPKYTGKRGKKASYNKRQAWEGGV